MSSTSTNALIHQTSPYLLQHAYNPVDWHPWNEETLAKARKENKLLIVSIGYSACHWCHVMERESFEDPGVAELMNSIFVPIKIDREERPDIDDIYMAACQYTRGSGGWPLNAVALPDGRPIWAGTYFPKEQWIDILNQFVKLFHSEYHKLETTADHLLQGIQHGQSIISTAATTLNKQSYDTMTKALLDTGDHIYGGRAGAPKFPMPHNWMYLLRYISLHPHKDAEHFLKLSLDRMANGGIYDHVGGGFSRYSVDAEWLVPHFEKMLYDNAQLLSLYSAAYIYFGDVRYKDTAYGILQHIDADLWTDKGVYAAMDADSEGIEGKYYVWSYRELMAELTDHPHRSYLVARYGITPSGNWEGKTVIRRSTIEDLHTVFDISHSQARHIEADFLHQLSNQRASRIRPETDTKIITAWNALTIIGYIDAYLALEDDYILEKAKILLSRIEQNAIQGDIVYRIHTGNHKIVGFLDDYATVIAAWIRMYEVTLDHSYLATAKYLCDASMRLFHSETSVLYAYTGTYNQALVAQRHEKEDNVIPSSNSIMAINLYKLGTLYDSDSYLERYRTMLSAIAPYMTKESYTGYYTNWGIAGLYSACSTEAICMGSLADKMTQELQRKTLRPITYGGNLNGETLPIEQYRYDEDSTLSYICKNHSCLPPAEQAVEAVQLIENDIS